eukprot:12423352-Karenia_brevis.AAC.1
MLAICWKVLTVASPVELPVKCTISPCRIRSLCKEQEDTKKGDESCQRHCAGVSFEKESWAVIRM